MTERHDDKQYAERSGIYFYEFPSGAYMEIWPSGAMKIDVGGSAHIRNIKEWHALAVASFAASAKEPREAESLQWTLAEHEAFDKASKPPSSTRRSESGEAFLGENDYREALMYAQVTMRDLAAGKPIRDLDEQIARIESLLDGFAPSASEPSLAVQELRNLVDSKRFDRQMFRDDTEWADWAQSRCRHTLNKADGGATDYEKRNDALNNLSGPGIRKE